MIVHMNLEAPFEFCAQCPHKEVYKGPMGGYFYCDNAEHCGYAVKMSQQKTTAMEIRAAESFSEQDLIDYVVNGDKRKRRAEE